MTNIENIKQEILIADSRLQAVGAEHLTVAFKYPDGVSYAFGKLIRVVRL